MSENEKYSTYHERKHAYYKQLVLKSREDAIAAFKSRQRQIAMGLEPAIKKRKKKKTERVWFSTRMLSDIVNSRFEQFSEIGINNRWQLQIRGKHLRRLLKKNKNVENCGRRLRKKT